MWISIFPFSVLLLLHILDTKASNTRRFAVEMVFGKAHRMDSMVFAASASYLELE